MKCVQYWKIQVL